MVKQTYYCDCCKNEIEEPSSKKMVLPILIRNKKTLCMQEMDVCEECAAEFMRLYYKIANEHGYSGILGLMYGEEDE